MRVPIEVVDNKRYPPPSSLEIRRMPLPRLPRTGFRNTLGYWLHIFFTTAKPFKACDSGKYRFNEGSCAKASNTSVLSRNFSLKKCVPYRDFTSAKKCCTLGLFSTFRVVSRLLITSAMGRLIFLQPSLYTQPWMEELLVSSASGVKKYT
ncbi:hypothetical protein D3C78_1186990 [compost metagenome]